MKIKIIILIAAILVLPLRSFGQLRVVRTKIDPLNRAMIYFSDIPSGFQSYLSEDKKKVNVKINNAGVVDSARITRGGGIIEDVYVQTKEDDLEINIVMKDKRGYTAVPLPYSRSLMIDVFKWDALSAAEDSYRVGLLAIEDGIRQVAKKQLVRAVKEGSADAAAMLGILLIREGELDDALDNLTFAVNNGTQIPDAYAGLSQIYSIKNDTENANKYSQKFAEMTGIKSFPKIKISPIADDDTLRSEAYSHVARLNDPFSGDSIHALTGDSMSFDLAADSPAADTARADSALLPIESTAKPWYFTVMTYIIMAGVALAAIVLLLYFRWRKNEMNKIAKKPARSEKFRKSLESAKANASTGAKRASETYKKSERIHGGRPEPQPEPEEEEPKLSRPSPEELKKLEQKELEDMLSQIRSKIDTSDEEPEDIEESEDSDEESEKSLGYSPKIELAMHLRNEQQKLKKQNLSSLDREELPTDVGKLSDIARKLGIEKGSLETRKAMENLKDDKELIEKLKSKFSKK